MVQNALLWICFQCRKTKIQNKNSEIIIYLYRRKLKLCSALCGSYYTVIVVFIQAKVLLFKPNSFWILCFYQWILVILLRCRTAKFCCMKVFFPVPTACCFLFKFRLSSTLTHTFAPLVTIMPRDIFSRMVGKLKDAAVHREEEQHWNPDTERNLQAECVQGHSSRDWCALLYRWLLCWSFV